MVQSETALIHALRAEATRLGLELTLADLPQLLGAVPDDLMADLMATAQAHGWDPIDFAVLFLAPLLDGTFAEPTRQAH